MSESILMDVSGRRRSPGATPGHWTGCAPPNKGVRYPADPPTVEGIILVMRQTAPGPYTNRMRGLIAILWRGLRIREALALTETDLDPKTGSMLVRAGKGGKRRMVGMDDWGWEHVTRWTNHRIQLPVRPLFCILAGPTRGRGWSPTSARGELRRLAAEAGVRRRFAPARDGYIARPVSPGSTAITAPPTSATHDVRKRRRGRYRQRSPRRLLPAASRGALGQAE